MSPDAPLFLYVGRLSREKSLPGLLLAFARTVASYPAARLRLVGHGPDGETLKALAADLGLAETVDFAGSKSGEALYAEYLGACALVLPSRNEPWGLLVNEALHFGCPVVVSDRCGCVPELVENSPCGFVFPCDDVAALAEAMAKAAALSADPESTARMCLARIAPFTPLIAANQIIAAVEAIEAKG